MFRLMFCQKGYLMQLLFHLYDMGLSVFLLSIFVSRKNISKTISVMKNPFYSNKALIFLCESNQSYYGESKQYILIIVMSQANIRCYKADFYSHEKKWL